MKPRPGSAQEVLLAFLRLGCTSFGGPVAHLGYFHGDLVKRRGWCSEADFAEVVAVAQSLPGPASSQAGVALGVMRAGWRGGAAAWLGFTLPSAVIMLTLALLQARFGAALRSPVAARIVHALGIVAVAVVAQAVLVMRRSLAPDAARMTVAVAAALLVLLVPAGLGMLAAILFGVAAGLLLRREDALHAPTEVGRFRWRGSATLAGCFAVLLAASLLAGPAQPSWWGVFAAFYRSGALVFGGGHVVLPLLQTAVVGRGWTDDATFLAGYGAAQALPGPLFTFAAFLGAAVRPAQHPLVNGLVALAGIFLPGLLLMAAALPVWGYVRSNRSVAGALRGVNASVVGVLLAALYRPVAVSAIHTWMDLGLALAAFALLQFARTAPWLVVLGVCAAGLLLRI